MSESVNRILVVDDNPATCYSTSRVIRAAGYKVIEAANGQSAVDLVSPEVSLVVLDVHLPDFDGFEVCRRIRALPFGARTPVIHLSATFVKDVDKVQGLEAGADGYLTHPVEPPVLIATINAFLRARDAEQERERLLVSERAARDEAERANRVKDEFLATLSHELRTPLNAIIGWTQVLQRTPDLHPDMRDGLDAIERNVTAQAQLIADLLDVSRIASNKIVLDLHPVELSRLVAAALDTIAPTAAAKGIELVRSLEPNAGTIVGDAGRLQQVIWNLANNAVKFTPARGRIFVRVAREGGRVRIEVADTGRGVRADFIPHIFERFRQEDATTTRIHGGLGLGLAIVKHIVDMHGGEVIAASDGENRGATFTVFLPIASRDESATDASAVARAESDRSPPTLAGRNVLVVDDDRDSRELLRRILSERRATVRTVASAHEALGALGGFTPDLLISDIAMPQQDGYDLIRKIRAGAQSPFIPAIALTAFAGEANRDRAIAAGFHAHLAKPLDTDELFVTIDAVMKSTPQPTEPSVAG